MCGICGVVAYDRDASTERDVVATMCGLLRHRGPDDEGYHADRHCVLGMRRLSIIDLATGHQPIGNEDGSLWLVFNGEIYNYRQLREALESRGHAFRTQSDSEVIVHAYEEYGDACVEHLNGMFAFAVWDAKRERLLLARDHVGIKPLYYWAHADRLVFGSELKAVLAHPKVPRDVDPAALDQLLTLEYIVSPRTILRGVHRLPAGHRLVFEKGRRRVEQYWDIPVREGPADADSCVEMLSELLNDAVRQQLVSDVPLGAFLSGGIDSSTVVAHMAEVCSEPVRTFSIGFGDPTYNELPFARAVATRFSTQHHEEYLNPDVAALAEQLIGHLDEPFGDFSILPTYLVSKLASEHVKVVLSGDGGDELFGGYESYVAQRLDRLYYARLPGWLRQQALPAVADLVPPRPAKKGLVNKAKRFVEGGALPPSLQHVRWMMFLTEKDRAALYRPDLRAAIGDDSPTSPMEGHFARAARRDPLGQQQYVDVKTYLVDDILTKVDRMSMAASIEARVPLLDHRIVEFAVNLPAHLKMHRGQTKVILRRAMAGRLPETTLRKPKQGFSIPLKNWLRGPLRPLMLDLLGTESVRRRGYFETGYVERLTNEHLSGSANHSHRLWALMVFELWQQHTLDRLPRTREVDNALHIVGSGESNAPVAESGERHLVS